MSLVLKVQQVHLGFLVSKEAVEHQDHLVSMDPLELLVCLEQRVQRELLELTDRMEKQDLQGQMGLLEREGLQDYQGPPVYQDHGVLREHKEREVTVVLLAIWESRDL